MKKIYSKITKERQKQFQIETYITQDGDEKQVVKKSIDTGVYRAYSRNAEVLRETPVCQFSLPIQNDIRKGSGF